VVTGLVAPPTVGANFCRGETCLARYPAPAATRTNTDKHGLARTRDTYRQTRESVLTVGLAYK